MEGIPKRTWIIFGLSDHYYLMINPRKYRVKKNYNIRGEAETLGIPDDGGIVCLNYSYAIQAFEVQAAHQHRYASILSFNDLQRWTKRLSTTCCEIRWDFFPNTV